MQFPPYTYVPGRVPHPVSDPNGHSYGQVSDHSASPSVLMNEGVLLFNRGYYWEAHETWEQVWLQRGRTTGAARFVKALIKLAACGVKCLEGNRKGAERHATRAVELLKNISVSDVDDGFKLTELRTWAIDVCSDVPVCEIPSDGTPQPLAGLQICTFPVDETSV